jgi:FAD/FMN-containing dehydrogenase
MALEAASVAVVTALDKAGLADLICPADSALYQERIASYWSLSAQKRPHCIVHPHTTEQVAQVLEAILSVPGCCFAIRSGGHIAWGASNIDGGVCIDLGVHMNSVSVDKEKGLVSIQPGARWRDVYKEIEPHGVAVAGGRTGGVGVGGLLTGGGISVSYLPCR